MFAIVSVIITAVAPIIKSAVHHLSPLLFCSSVPECVE
jgi:hypothetical protein